MASDEDPVIISFKEAALRQTDVATLQPREWLGVIVELHQMRSVRPLRETQKRIISGQAQDLSGP